LVSFSPEFGVEASGSLSFLLCNIYMARLDGFLYKLTVEYFVADMLKGFQKIVKQVKFYYCGKINQTEEKRFFYKKI
jgi:hypothetical protein